MIQPWWMDYRDPVVCILWFALLATMGTFAFITLHWVGWITCSKYYVLWLAIPAGILDLLFFLFFVFVIIPMSRM